MFVYHQFQTQFLQPYFFVVVCCYSKDSCEECLPIQRRGQSSNTFEIHSKIDLQLRLKAVSSTLSPCLRELINCFKRTLARTALGIQPNLNILSKFIKITLRMTKRTALCTFPVLVTSLQQ